MLYGDPYKIALQFDAVKEWNMEGCSWVNGLFSVYIGGEPFLCNTENTTLNIFFFWYARLIERESFGNNKSIKTRTIDYYNRLYKKIYDSIYVDDILNDDEISGFFDISSPSLSDFGKNIYVSLGEDDVILYGDGDKGRSSILPGGTLLSLFNDMNKYPLFSFFNEGIKWEETYHYYASHEYIKMNNVL
ncbi:Imm42 family immunity protein [Bombella saccharophila]|uniref:Immunity 42 family protein n=1 Tax=Bombella saccharophila TaxID=2967338 RepID=A0ABT3W828_9PROT|nr:Imm42 family immunity protein [Bombella saccharophila]MCX5615232.1 immunity 42 family protein [Bombella saccharophila]